MQIAKHIVTKAMYKAGTYSHNINGKCHKNSEAVELAIFVILLTAPVIA